MKNLRLLFAVLVFTTFIVGCKDSGEQVAGKINDQINYPTNGYTYKAYDSNGNVVVEGTFSLTINKAGEVSGSWAFEKRGQSDKIGPQVGTGSLNGKKDGSAISINLNPGWADNNVFLNGKIENGKITGKWSWSTFIGPTSEGNFEATGVYIEQP
ncbi:MAG: hypothetical protein HY089_01470 [Ignavibacteriales bacterium]|nr:hypothetical protein [Ignavibacteriales bacterium]